MVVTTHLSHAGANAAWIESQLSQTRMTRFISELYVLSSKPSPFWPQTQVDAMWQTFAKARSHLHVIDTARNELAIRNYTHHTFTFKPLPMS